MIGIFPYSPLSLFRFSPYKKVIVGSKFFARLSFFSYFVISRIFFTSSRWLRHSGFRIGIGLCVLRHAHPLNKPVCGFCSSYQKFTASFLHPTNSTTGLAPARYRTCRAHLKKALTLKLGLLHLL